MTLVDRQIAKRVEQDGLIDSYDPNCLTNIGYDLRAKAFYVNDEKSDSVTLLPNESVFVESVETVKMPTNLLGRVALKNSRIRQGFTMDSPVYQPGHKTRIYFRLTNVSADELTLYKGDKYATIMFETLGEEPEHPYEGTFKDEFSFRGLGDYRDVYKRQKRELDKKVEDLEAAESRIYGNVLAILSIFMALFSFLTVNVTLTVNSATIDQYLIFNALMLGGISFLVALINTVTGKAKHLVACWVPSAICFIVAFGLYLL